MAGNFSLHQCYSWLNDEIADDKEVTLVSLNDAFRKRNMGGIVFVTILMIVGCIGNVHVLLLYLLKFRKSNYKIYILVLACLDMLNCCVSMPMIIVYLWFQLSYPSDWFCKFFRSALTYVTVGSELILMVIAVDRYRKICAPLKPQLTIKQTKLVCFITLCATLLFTWPIPILYGRSTVYTGIANITGVRCYTADDYKGIAYQAHINKVLTMIFVIITVVLSSLYYHIVRTVRKHLAFRKWFRASESGKNEPKRDKRARDRKTTITLFMVTIGYVLSALPFHILALIIFIKTNFDCLLSFEMGMVFCTFIWIFLVNNILNPFIYGFSDKRFRRELVTFYGGIVRPLSRAQGQMQSLSLTSTSESRDITSKVTST